MVTVERHLPNHRSVGTSQFCIDKTFWNKAIIHNWNKGLLLPPNTSTAKMESFSLSVPAGKKSSIITREMTNKISASLMDIVNKIKSCKISLKLYYFVPTFMRASSEDLLHLWFYSQCSSTFWLSYSSSNYMSEIIHSKLEKYLLDTNVHRKKNNIFNTTETPIFPLLSAGGGLLL